MNLERIIKLVLATLLFLCLLKMPYGYFQLVRFVAVGAFAILAYHANSKQKKNEMIVYICLAILFQPFFKITLGREIWNIVDVIVGVVLIATIFWKERLS